MGPLNLEPGSVVASRFRVTRLLGRGGMGAVYLAEDLSNGQAVALKLLELSPDQNPTVVERFRREATATSRLTHPGIVRVLASGEAAAGLLWLAMEPLEGQTLATLTSDHRLFEPAVAAAIGVELLDALEAAHQAGVFHRDLKPANVMLATSPRRAIVLLDFGISKLAHAAAQLTITGDLLGTPGYMAPEQLGGERNVGPEVDLYALGVVLFELLSGKLPFRHGTEFSAMRDPRQRAAPPLESVRPGLSPALYRAVDALLAPDPSARPGSAAEVKKALLLACPPDLDRVWGLLDSNHPQATHTLPAHSTAPGPSDGMVKLADPRSPASPRGVRGPARRAWGWPPSLGVVVLGAFGLGALLVLAAVGADLIGRRAQRLRAHSTLLAADDAIDAGELDRAAELLSSCLVATFPCDGAAPRLETIRWRRFVGEPDGGKPSRP